MEIFESGSWEAIYDLFWTDDETDAVCRWLQNPFERSKRLICISINLALKM